MMKQKWVAICDLCGEERYAENAIFPNGPHALPEGWKRAWNERLDLCAACAEAFEKTRKEIAKRERKPSR